MVSLFLAISCSSGSQVQEKPNIIFIMPERETLPSFLKKHGYATACVGKWHLGFEWTSSLPPNSTKKPNATTIDPTGPIKNGPLDRGFDYFFGTPQSELFYIENDRILGELTLLKTKEEIIARSYVHKRYSPCWAATGHDQRKVLKPVAEKSTEWIESQAENPFFLYLPLPSPHNPIVPGEDFEGKSGLNPHADFCMETDWVVGQVLQKLDELKIADNTIVIFTADNGTSASNNIYEVLQSKGHYPSWIYRGCKWTLWEGGHRMPYVVRWPKGIKAGGESAQTICTTDLFATCADVLSVKKLPDTMAEDSYSFLPLLNNKKINGLEDRLIVHASFEGQFAVRKGKWKLLFDNNGGTSYKNQRNPKDANNPVINNADILLFDMEKDAVESINLSAEYPEVVEELKKDFAEVIKNGRSNPGKAQPTDLYDPDLNWPQIEKVKEYIY